MFIREIVKRNPKITAGITLLVTVVAVYSVVRQPSSPTYRGQPTTAFYSIDEGTSWFVDSIEKLAPFKKNGIEYKRPGESAWGKRPPGVISTGSKVEPTPVFP